MSESRKVCSWLIKMAKKKSGKRGWSEFYHHLFICRRYEVNKTEKKKVHKNVVSLGMSLHGHYKLFPSSYNDFSIFFYGILK